MVNESQVQKKQKNKSSEIEDHRMDTMQSKRKYDNSGNSGCDDLITKSKYYCSNSYSLHKILIINLTTV